MKVLNKTIAALLVFVFLLGVFPAGMIPTASALTAYTDVSGHWGAGYINRLNRMGFLDPEVFTGTRFYPNQYISRVEFFSMLVSSMGATARADVSVFNDIADLPEHLRDIVAIANQMGIAFGYTDSTMRPNGTLLRQEAAALVARALGMNTVAEWNMSIFSDAAFISSYARTYVAALVERGVISGFPDSSFRPSGYLTRAEAAKIIDLLFANVYMPETGFRNVYLQGSLLIQSPGAELRDAIIDGDVIIGDGVGNGNVVISDCTINGRLVVRGGGPNSVTISNSAISEGLYIASFSADTRVSVTDNSAIPVIETVSGFTLAGSGVPEVTILENARKNASVNLTGVSLSDLNINGDGAKVKLNTGHIINTRFGDSGQSASLDLAANTSVGHLIISAPNVTVTGTGSIRNLIINHSGAVVAQNPELLSLGVNVIASVSGKSVASSESQWANNIDRVSNNSPLKVVLLSNTTTYAPFDQASLSLSMVAGRASSDVHVSQSASNRVPLTQRGNRMGYWVGFFIPAPSEAGSMASVTYTYIDGDVITLPPRTLDNYNGRQGLLLYLPVFREAGREIGLLKEVLYINWGGHLTENIQFLSSTMHLATLNATQTAALQKNFDEKIMYSIQSGASPYTGAEATRRILNSDNPLGLPSNDIKGLDAINRALSSTETRSILEDPQFANDFKIDTTGNSQYSALSNAGKQYVAEQVLAARRNSYTTASAVKAAFDKAVQARLLAETTLLSQINSSVDYAALRRIIETAANATVLQFQTGADPYKSFTALQKDKMADYLWRLRQFRSIQEVIDAIRNYLGDPANAPGGSGGSTDIRDMSIRRIAVNPTTATFSENNYRDITLSVELTDGKTLTPAQIAQLISDGVITYTWNNGTTLSTVGSVSRPDTSSNIYRVLCVNSGTDSKDRSDKLTFTLTDAAGKKFTATVSFTVEEKRFATAITLPASIKLLCGESQVVRATLTPANSNDHITWSITTGGLATIVPLTDGRVEVVANNSARNGVAELTAITERGHKATMLVMVFRDPYDVVVDPASIILTPGSSLPITAYTYSPETLLRWDVVPDAGGNKKVNVTQSGVISAPADAVDGTAQVTVYAVGSDPIRDAFVDVTIKKDPGVSLMIDRSIMYNTEKQQLHLNVADPSMQGQRYYVQVSGGLGGTAARCITAQPVRATDEIFIEADSENVGRVTIRLTVNPSPSSPQIGNDIIIIVSPKSVSNVKFHHTATSREAAGLVKETEYGHILEMKLADTSKITPLIAAQPGQPSSGPVSGYVALTQTMTWYSYESDYNRQILRDVRTRLVGTDYFIVDRAGAQIGGGIKFDDVFRREDLSATAVPRPEGDYSWWRGYYKFGLSTTLRTTVERDAQMIKLPASVLNSGEGNLRSRDTGFTGLAAVNITPSRGRLTEDQLQQWGNLFYNDDQVELFVGGRVNPLIARESEFALERLDSGVWIPVDEDDPLEPYRLYDAGVQAQVESGGYRIVDVNGKVLRSGPIAAIVVGDPNESSNTFFVRMLPNDLPRPTSPWLNNLSWRAPTGVGDPGAVGLIPIVPGSNDLYDYREPGDYHSLSYPYLSARMISTTNITPDNIGVTLLGASTYMVLMSMPFPSSPPRPQGVYTDYYIVQQHSKLGFARIGTDGTIDSNRQEAVVSPEYPNTSPYLTYTLTLKAPEIYTAVVTEGDTGNITALSGVADAVMAAGINPFSLLLGFSVTNSAILSVNAGGIYQALASGSVTLSVTEGTLTAEVIVVVDPAYELIIGTPITLSLRDTVQRAAKAAGFTVSNTTNNTTYTEEPLSNVILPLGTISITPTNVGPTAVAAGLTEGYTAIRITDPVSGKYAIMRIKVVTTSTGISPLMIGIDTQADTLPGVGAAAASAGFDPDTISVKSKDSSKLMISDDGTATPKAKGNVDVELSDPDGKAFATVTVEIVERSTTTNPTAPTTPAEPNQVTPETPAPPPPPVITAVKLRTTASVGTNKVITLVPYITPYNSDKATLKWSSSNTAVATVVNGVVTGIKAGTATITATNESGSIKADCRVTVKAETRLVTSITISKATLNLDAGAASTLTVSYKPTTATIKGVAWTSSNETVARVEPTGKVVAVAEGTAIITAISDSGMFTASCTVSVKVPVSSVTLSEKRVSLKIGETYQMVPVITPDNATVTTAAYTSRSSAIASVSVDGLITANKAGTTIITVRVDGKSVTCTVVVSR